MSMKHRAGWLALAVVGVSTVAFPGVAWAHTEAEATAVEAGLTSITFTPEQECGAGSLPTTGLRVQLPPDASQVRPVADTGWSADATDSEVSWTLLPGAEATSVNFAVTLLLGQPAGSTVYLPTIQQCPDGEEIVWLQVPASPGETLRRPAPSIVVPENATVATTEAPVSTTSTSEPAATPATSAEPTTSSDDGGLPAVAIVMFVVAIAILGGAMVIVLRIRRREQEP